MCDLFPLKQILILVMLSLLSVSTLSLSPVFALRFDVECIVAFSSLFAVERQGGLVCFEAVVVIVIGLECALWCCA